MRKEEFVEIISLLETMTRSITKDQVNIMYETFVVEDKHIFRKAVMNLISEWKRPAFPPVGIIKEELSYMKRELGVGDTAKKERCSFCGSTGIIEIEEVIGNYRHHVAKLCTCSNAKRYEKSFDEAQRFNGQHIGWFVMDAFLKREQDDGHNEDLF